MERTVIESDLLQSVGYDPETKTLEVEFKHRKENTPPKVYRYTNFPADKFAEFMAAESKGKFFLRNIKPFEILYPYERVVEEEKKAERNPIEKEKA